MIFFLNLNGELTRADTGRIFQGSTAVPDIKVLSTVSATSGSLSVAFTKPDKTTTKYYPLAIEAEHTNEQGFTTYVWGIRAGTPEQKKAVTDLLGNVTQEVGKVGVSVRQTNVVLGASYGEDEYPAVASYTAEFEVEYSALPASPTEATADEIDTLLDLLYAYYAQNVSLIDGLTNRVDALERKDVLADIKTINTDTGGTQGLKTSDTGISWDNAFKFFDANGNQTASGTIKQNVPITEGFGINLEIDQQDGVARVDLDLQPFPPNTNESCYVLAPNGFASPGAYEQLTVVKTSNLTYDVRVGEHVAGTITIPQDTYLDAVEYNPETKELKFTYNTSSGKQEIVIPLSDLEDVNNLLIATSQSELNSLLVSANVGKAISYNGDLYVVARENNSIIAKEIANIADVNLIDTWLDTDFEDMEYDDKVGISWSSKYELSNGNKVYGQGDIAQCVPIVAGKNVSIGREGKTFKINVDSATQLYETAVESEGDTAPEEIDQEQHYGTRVAYMYEGQRFPEVGDLVIFKCDIPNSKGQNLILCSITSLDDFDDPEPYVEMRAICFLQGASGTEALEGATINLASMPAENITITNTGIYTHIPEVELELQDGRLIYMQSRNTIPLVAGEGVEFKNNPNNTVSINATGGGGGSLVTDIQIGSDITELGINPDGKGIDVTYNDAEIEYDGGDSYSYFPVEITLPLVAGENVTFETDETNNVVKIDVPSADGELVDNLAYADLVDVPILIADLDTITPTANTYYKHNGADETTYTKGVIYFYDGTAFKAITGGGAGGISDVQVNGTSVVTDGVANIPPADGSTTAGVIVPSTYTDPQDLGEYKFINRFYIGYKTQGTSECPQLVCTGYGNLYIYGSQNRPATLLVHRYPGAGGIELHADRNAIYLNANNNKKPYFYTGATLYLPTSGNGTLMSAPSTWSEGTSGSATLPEAGLYEVKTGILSNVYSSIINWDGINHAYGQLFATGTGTSAATIFVVVNSIGVISKYLNGEATELGSVISFRKIGIA